MEQTTERYTIAGRRGERYVATVAYGTITLPCGAEDDGATITVTDPDSNTTQSVEIGSVAIALGGIGDAIRDAADAIASTH